MKLTSPASSSLTLILALILGLGLAFTTACHSLDETGPSSASSLTIEIVHKIPHPGAAFTQGFIYDNGLVESAGGYGDSYMQRYQPGQPVAQQKQSVDAKYFAEGLARLGDHYYLLSWRNGTAFEIDKNSLQPLREMSYKGEGWGLTSDGENLVMSNGSNIISFRDPTDFLQRRQISVQRDGQPVPLINELEWVNGQIYANVWYQDIMLIIDPQKGEVIATVDLSPPRQQLARDARVDTLNGIAWDATAGKLYLTGKRWPYIFEVRLIAAPDGSAQ